MESISTQRTHAWSRTRPVVVAGAIIGVSAVLRLSLTRSFAAPWIAPDEMIYGITGRTLWASGHVSALGLPAPFYGLYPVLVGLPLHLFGAATGVGVIQCAQALLMPLAAVVTWAWARPLAGRRWALAAAGLVLAMPALSYSGLLMSEAAFLPAGTLALWLMARAIARPTAVRQALLVGAIVLATGVRFQGVVFVPVLLTAALLSAWFAREPTLLRRLWPTWAGLGGAIAVWLLLQLALHGTLARGLGAYSVAAAADYQPREVVHWVFLHAGDLFLLVLGAPLVAVGVLAYAAARGRERSVEARALVAVTVATSFWLPIQVGMFASRYVDQLAERDLIVCAPPLFVCLALWLARGLPRPQPSTSVIGLVAAVPAVLLPVTTLVTPRATPDAFMTVPLARIAAATSTTMMESIWVGAAAGIVALAVLLPRRGAAPLVALLAAALLISSGYASSEVARRTQADEQSFFGGASHAWVDDAGRGPVTYLYSGSAYWNGIWKTAFWNERVQHLARFSSTPIAIPSIVVSARPDGRLLTASGRPLPTRDVVAATSLSFFGTPLAQIAQPGLDQAGRRLWQTDGPPRLSTAITGLEPNGDIVAPVRIVVYACGPGRLELTLLGKQGTPVVVARDGMVVERFTPPPNTVWTGTVPAPEDADGTTTCTYTIRSPGLVGSTKIVFTRD